MGLKVLMLGKRIVALVIIDKNETMIALQKDEVRKLYPHADEREVFLRVTARRLGPELMKAVYGWQADD